MAKPLIRILPLTVFGLLAALLAGGCARGGRTATFGSGDNLLSSGEYAAQAMDASGRLIRITLNQNNTYTQRKLLGTCLLVESRGEWKSTNEMMEFRQLEARSRPDCENEAAENWQVDKAEKVSEKNIRNITPKSFEILEQDESTSAEWVKYSKP